MGAFDQLHDRMLVLEKQELQLEVGEENPFELH